jgi:hypothetical protein
MYFSLAQNFPAFTKIIEKLYQTRHRDFSQYLPSAQNSNGMKGASFVAYFYSGTLLTEDIG